MTARWRAVATATLYFLCVGLAAPAGAQDALRGKALYANTNGAPISCADGTCHGSDPTRNQANVLKGANNAPVIETAIATKIAEMRFLSAYVTHQDALDLAAYLANPGVTAAPRIAVSPTSFAFASTYTGSASAITAVVVSNTGTANLLLTSIAVGGANGTEFRVEPTSTCTASLTLVPAASCRVDLTFRPTTPGSKSATLAFVHNAAGSPTSVALTGTGLLPPAPAIAVTPPAITFPATIAGNTSSIYSVTASNTGSATLTFSSIAVSGANAADFRIQPSSTCSTMTGVAAGASCRVDVVFAPTVIGTPTASLVFAHNAPGGTSSVVLNGTSTAAPTPTIAVSASSLTFVAQEVATQSAAQSITVTNVGSAALGISAVNAGGANAGDFVRSGTCAAGASLVASGGSCSIVLVFAPTAVGTRSATWTIVSNNSGGDVTLAASGTATTNVPTASASPMALTFGPQQTGTSSASQAVVVRNVGGGTLNVGVVTASGASFASTGTCAGASLQANQACTVNVVFAPAASGTLTATLAIAHNASASPLSVSLSGTGTTAPVPVVQIAPLTVAFPGVTAVGQPSPPQRVTFTNSGPGAVTLGALTISGNEFAIAGAFTGACTAGQGVAQGASCAIDVVFSPTAAGARAGTLTVTSNGTPSLLSVALSGSASSVASASITADRTALDFGSVAVSNQAPAQPVWLTNTGSTNLNVTALAVAPPFALVAGGTCPTPPFSLIASQACLQMVGFAPTAGGAVSGVLSVTSNAGTLSIALAGSGTVPISGQSPGQSPSTGVSSPPVSNKGGGGALTPVWLLVLAGIGLLRSSRRRNSCVAFDSLLDANGRVTARDLRCSLRRSPVHAETNVRPGAMR